MIGTRTRTHQRERLAVGWLLAGLLLAACRSAADADRAAPRDPELAARGTIEVTARLVEIPEGAIFQRDLYNYATILKYEVVTVHRGELPGSTLYVAHYNPWLPRAAAADARVEGIGGNLRAFETGQVHRLALDAPLEDHFMGGVVNKYFGQDTGTLYWAVWTNLAEP
ncbi:MAG: hypothetical protein MUF48_07705 [Pirellulaceae bacterium]|jgi:hypothetical protein|nr:hypothetical protein [Pirellulaceae bacterium]